MKRALLALLWLLLSATAMTAELTAEDGKQVPFKEGGSGALGTIATVVALAGLAVAGVYGAQQRRKGGALGDITIVASKRIGMRSGLILVRVKDKEMLLAHSNDRIDLIESWTSEQKKDAI